MFIEILNPDVKFCVWNLIFLGIGLGFFFKKKNTKSKKLLIIKQNSEQERASLFFSFFLFLLFFPIMRKKIVLWIILIYEIQANNKSKIISFFGLLTESTLWK